MKEIDIIDNYRDLCIGDYQDIVAICKQEDMEELDRQVKIISVLTKLDEGTILDLPIADFKRLAGKLSFLEGELPITAGRLAESYKIGDFNLVPVKDMRKVTTAQYIDFQTFHQAGFEEHFVEILSCLLVPKGKKYSQDYDILEVQDAIRKNLNAFDAASLYAFFLISCKDSIRDMLISSLQETTKIKDKTQRERIQKELTNQLTLLKASGDGSQM